MEKQVRSLLQKNFVGQRTGIDGDGENEIIAAGFTNQSKTNDVVIVDDSSNANPVAYAYYESSGAGKLKSVGGIRELPRNSTSYIAKDDSLMRHQEWIAECVSRGLFLASHHNHFMNAAVTDEDIKLAVDIAEDAFGVVAARHPELGLK